MKINLGTILVFIAFGAMVLIFLSESTSNTQKGVFTLICFCFMGFGVLINNPEFRDKIGLEPLTNNQINYDSKRFG